MNRFILNYLGIFFLLLSILSFFNIIYSYYFNLYLNINTYFYTLLISLIIGAILLKKSILEELPIRDTILKLNNGAVFNEIPDNHLLEKEIDLVENCRKIVLDTLNNLNVIVKKDNRYCLFIGDNKEKLAIEIFF